MQILIDLQGAQNSSRQRGIGRYSLALAKAIARNAGDHKVFVLLSALFPETIDELRASLGNWLTPDRFLVFTAPGPVAELRLENTWRRRSAEVVREYFLTRFSPDVVLATSLIEGAEDNTVTSIGILGSSVPTAAVLYDLIPLADPNYKFGSESEEIWYAGKIESLKRADALFAISKSAADEAVRLLAIESSRLRNISAAADSAFTRDSVSFTEVAAVARRLGIVRSYLMHASAFEFRKNFQGLIRAYAALPLTVRATYQLVLVCKLTSLQMQELIALAKGVGLGSQDIVLTNFVSDSDLVALYAGCHLFVFPSFHEGFGLPALEAMCCGAPAIGSNTTSVPAVIGREDALFDPFSVASMTTVILKALTDAEFYASLKAHANTQAAKFSWDETGKRAISGLEDLFSSTNRIVPSDGNCESIRQAMLDAVANVARTTNPNDLEILELARSIDANDAVIHRMKTAAASTTLSESKGLSGRATQDSRIRTREN